MSTQNEIPLIETIAVEGSDPVLDLKTDWEDRSKCGCKCAYVPAIPATFWGHWQIRPLIPVCLSIGFILSYIVYLIFTIPNLQIGHSFDNQSTTTLVDLLLFVMLLCVSISYVLTIAKGPGYLPFHYPHTKRTNYTWEEMMSSLALYQEQVDFAKNAQAKPPRSSFSIDARRYVLRADHICGWMQTWIGLNNYRYFTLTIGWATAYCFTYVCLSINYFIIVFTDLARGNGFDYASIVMMLFNILLFGVGCYSAKHLVLTIIHMVHNRTSLEVWFPKDEQSYDRGCVVNTEEVCGTCAMCPLMPFPCYCHEQIENGIYATYFNPNYTASKV